MSRIAAVALAVLVGAACVSPAPSVPDPDAGQRDGESARALGARLDSIRSALRIPGLAVVVLRDTTILLAQGFGLADLERHIPVTPETPFNIASVSKPISAVVALRLVQDGRLDLDRPMRRYAGFIEFCDAARGDGGVFFGDFACGDDRLSLRHVLSMTANGEQPGTRFWYNPPSYSWASRPMAEVAGRTFSELVDSLVFRPAGMRNSARTNRRLPLPPRIAEALAVPYHIDSAGQVVRSNPPPPQGDGAAGGVIATAMDLARFDIALGNDRLLTPASRAALWSPTRTPSGGLLPYGLGWFLGSYEGRRVAWHTGLWEGQYSALYLKVLGDTPAERLTLILLANSDAVQWQTGFDEAAIERSPFARAFLSGLPRRSAGLRRAEPLPAGTYQVVHGWPTLPESEMLGIVSAVAVDSHNHVFILDRRDRVWPGSDTLDTTPIKGATVRVFDGRTGVRLTEWAANTLALPHGITIDASDNVWLTDVALHQVYKYSHDGVLLLTAGERGVSGEDSSHFNRPSGVVAAPDGSFYVSDGYGNNRVMAFAPDGRFLFQWGVKGQGPGQFDLPHGIARDRAGLLYVSDRSNGRVQIFDARGHYLKEWKGPALASPNNVAITRDGTALVVDDGGKELIPDRSGIVVLAFDGSFLERFGRYGNYDGQFVAVHSVAVGPDGAVYVADADGKRVQKFVRRRP